MKSRINFVVLILCLTLSSFLAPRAKHLQTHPKEIALSATRIAPRISFDLDETLVSSANLTNADIEKVLANGYMMHITDEGQKYFIRPGTEELLKFASRQGFELMILTHNFGNYARDVIDDAKLDKYFVDLRSIEDIQQPYNLDFKKYPNHRNKTYPQRDFFDTYTKGLYKGLIKRSWLKLQGNSNLLPYVPSQNVNKYPPIYGARMHIDNAVYNVEDPEDFVGILVEPFRGFHPEPKDGNGDYLWVEILKDDIEKLRRIGWADLYRQTYGKEPVVNRLEVILD